MRENVTDHLSSQAISEWVTGERGPGVHQHLELCVECREKVETLAKALEAFGASVRDWGDGQYWSLPGAPARQFRGVRLALACTFVAAVAMFGMRFAARHPNPTEAPLVGVSDAAVLRQVQADLAKPVAGPMMPLTRLVALDAASPSESR